MEIKQVFIGLIPIVCKLSDNTETIIPETKQIIKYNINFLFGLNIASNGFLLIFLKWKSKILIKIN